MYARSTKNGETHVW